jgi:hypothetical protein
MFKSRNYVGTFVVLLAIAGLFAVAQATFHLFTEPVSAAPGPVPTGTIIAWNRTSGAIPSGWAVCDGTNGTPDLRGRFLRGVATFADVGRMEGNEKHGHSVSGTTDNPRSSNADAWGDTDLSRTKVPQATGLDHTHKFSGSTTVDVPHIPPSYTVIYLMKK